MAELYRANTRFTDVLQHALNRGLQTFMHLPLTRETFGEIYLYIRDSIDELFSKASFNPSSNTKTWIAQKFYMSISLNSGEVTTPQVFEPVAIRDISTDELRLIGGLLSDCHEIAGEIATELRRRVF